MEKDERNYGIDCLRIVLTFFICVLHTLGQGGVLSATSSTPYKYNIYWFIETFAFCAVDGYALISGYASNADKLNVKRISKLWFEVFFYSFVITLIISFLSGKPLNALVLLESCFPILTNQFWYMTAYFPLFFFMPLINKGLDKLSKKEAKYLLAALIIIFCCFGILNDNYTEYGYHFLWLLILFVVGSLVRKLHLFEKFNNFKLICIYVICIVITCLPMFIFKVARITNYNSPTIVLSGIVILILFSRLKPNKKVVTFLYPFTTGIYLFQNNAIVWSFLENRFVFVSNYNLFIGVVLVLLLASAIFIIGTIVDYIRALLFKLLKIDQLCLLLSKSLTSFFNKTCDFIYSLIE